MKPEQGKVALATGGAHGIGRATAIMLSQRGLTVISFDKDSGANRELDRQTRESTESTATVKIWSRFVKALLCHRAVWQSGYFGEQRGGFCAFQLYEGLF